MLLTCPQGPAGRSGAKGRGSGDGPGPWGLASGSWDLSPAWSVSAMNGPHTGHTSGTVLQGQLLSGRWCPCLAARLGPQGPGPGGESCPRSFISVTGPPPQRSAEGTVKPPPPRSALEGGQGLRPVPAAAPQPQDPTQGRPPPLPVERGRGRGWHSVRLGPFSAGVCERQAVVPRGPVLPWSLGAGDACPSLSAPPPPPSCGRL